MIKRRNKRNKTDIMKSIIQNGVRVEKYKNKQEREINISQQLKKYEEENKRIEQRKEKQKEIQRKRPMFYQGNGNGK
tara:strand:- start:86 stop:316 length:231 start_codon:yes stop_codon:yes gene_type:complete